jgi:hypothetical protein
MITRTLSASLTVVLAVACNSPAKDAYRRLASKANPLLTAMKPVAEKLLALKPDDRTAIIEVCMTADEQLELLRSIDFDAEHVTPGARHEPVSTYAKSLLQDRSLMCNSDIERASPGWCSNWCLERWTGMIEAVDRLRQAAKAEGVEIVSLRP